MPRPLHIALIGDIHGNTERLGAVLPWLAAAGPDVALLSGDLALDPPWREPDRHHLRQSHDASFLEVLSMVGAALACPVIFVPGNHDLDDPPPAACAVNADGRVVEAAGLRIAGYGGAGPALFGFPYEWTDERAASDLESLFGLAGGQVDVFVCHAPPVRTRLDVLASSGEHVGSEAVRDAIAAHRPRLMVCGHIHESWGTQLVEGVPVVNAGALGEPFGQRIAWMLEWDGGLTRAESLRQVRGDVERKRWI